MSLNKELYHVVLGAKLGHNQETLISLLYLCTYMFVVQAEWSPHKLLTNKVMIKLKMKKKNKNDTTHTHTKPTTTQEKD